MNTERMTLPAASRVSGSLPGFHGSRRKLAPFQIGVRNSEFGVSPQSWLTPAATGRRRLHSAFSLIEIMVTMTLLSLIVIGLLAVFSHLQGALRAVNNQSDVFEGARATVNLVSRDISQLAAGNVANVNNFLAYEPVTPVVFPRPGGGVQTTHLRDIVFLTRHNDTWSGVGYFIDRANRADAVGTLYRFNLDVVSAGIPTNVLQAFVNARIGDTNVHRVTDGVIHFTVAPFDELGRVYPVPYQSTNAQIIITPTATFFRGSYLPAHVEMEMGILEPNTLRQFRAINSSDTNVARRFLTEQLGRMHFFRQRIPIRNHNQPEAFD